MYTAMPEKDEIASNTLNDLLTDEDWTNDHIAASSRKVAHYLPTIEVKSY